MQSSLPAGFFISVRRFKKKTRFTVVDLGKSGDRRLDVRDQIDNQRDEIAALGELAELVARRRHRRLAGGSNAQNLALLSGYASAGICGCGFGALRHYFCPFFMRV